MTTYRNLFETPQMTMSLLSPLPIVAKVMNYGEHVVYWNGIVMPYSAAMYIALRAGNIYPTPNVRDKIANVFRRLRHTGALRKGPAPIAMQEMNRFSSHDPFTGYESVLRKHMAAMNEKYTTKDWFKMLNMENAQEIFLDQAC